jgi:hypothetical protein
MKDQYKKIFKISLVCFVLLFIFIKTYSIHFTNPYPEHVDEWQHLAISKQILDKGFVERRPYFEEDLYHFDLEPGFHLFLAGLMLVDNNLILHYKYLAATFAVISALILFFFMLRIFKRYDIAIFSILFFASLKSSVNILGLNFFVPLTMAIPFLFLFLWFFIESLEKSNTKQFFISFIILLILLSIHPPSALILIPVIIFKLIANKNFILKNRLKISLSFLVPLIIVFYYLGFVWWGHIVDTRNFIFELLIFRKGFSPVEIVHFLPYLYGVVAFAIALFGIYVLYKQKQDKSIVILALTSFFFIFLYNNFGFSIFAPYQRVLYYSLLSLVPLSAIGLGYILEKLKSYFPKNISKYSSFILFLIILIIFAFVFTSSYEIVDSKQVYSTKVIDDSSYNALLWLKDNYEKHNVIMTPIMLSSAVYPITENYVVSIPPGQISGGNYTDNQDFYQISTSCDYKKDLLEKHNVDFVISDYEINCDYLIIVYDQEKLIYQYERN